jgi:hypothetical protein
MIPVAVKWVVASGAGDTLVFATFLTASQDEAYKTKLHDLTVAYWVCICQATLVSLIALVHKLRQWRDQLQARFRAAHDAGIGTQQTRREVLLAKITKSRKTCIAYVLAILVAVFEARPASALRCLGQLAWLAARCSLAYGCADRICRWARSRSCSRSGGTASLIRW